MKFTLDTPAPLMIRTVSRQGIGIGEETYAHAIALTSPGEVEAWVEKPIVDLTIEDFEALLATSPELIVLGTGERYQFAPRELSFTLARRGIGLEVMDTAAAARTFNILAAENRLVAAVLYV